MRLVIALALGFLLSLAFLGIAFAADGHGGIWHQIGDVFVGPPLWLLQSALPALHPSLAIQPGSPYSGASFFILFFGLFWWLICSVLVFVARRQPPNNSFKPTPLRGAA